MAQDMKDGSALQIASSIKKSQEGRIAEFSEHIRRMTGPQFEGIMRSRESLRGFLIDTLEGKGSADDVLNGCLRNGSGASTKTERRDIAYSVAAKILGTSEASTAMTAVFSLTETMAAAHNYHMNVDFKAVYGGYPARELLEIGSGSLGRKEALMTTMRLMGISTNAIGSDESTTNRAASVVSTARAMWERSLGDEMTARIITEAVGIRGVRAIQAQESRVYSTP